MAKAHHAFSVHCLLHARAGMGAYFLACRLQGLGGLGLAV